MNLSKMYFIGLTLLCLCACTTPDQQRGGWKKVFHNDENGDVIFGDKSELLDAVRLGYPVRIGWGSNRIEHVAEASFLTIFDGEEVFAQINTIIGQMPVPDADSLKIRFRPQNHWTKMAGTNGYVSGLMTDYLEDEVTGGGTDRYAHTAWYVLYPSSHSTILARPLWQKSSPHWEQWNANQ